MADPNIAITILIVDFPRADLCDPSDWDCVIDATIGAAQQTGTRYGMVATLPELMPETVARTLIEAGVVPFSGLSEAIAACAAAVLPPFDTPEPITLPNTAEHAEVVTEAEAKKAMSKYDLRTPRAKICGTKLQVRAVSLDVGYPQVIKGSGIAHKTDAGAVKLNIMSADDAITAVAEMNAPQYLIEEMITGTVAELLIGVVRDPAHGFVLTLGAGGTLTEILQDSASVLVPASTNDITHALMSLKIAPLLTGYRGAPAANIDAILRAIQAVQDYTLAHADTLHEIEINPLICTPTDAIAADALLRRAP